MTVQRIKRMLVKQGRLIGYSGPAGTDKHRTYYVLDGTVYAVVNSFHTRIDNLGDYFEFCLNARTRNDAGFRGAVDFHINEGHTS